MVIENVMYFALGFLGAALLFLMIVPAVWARAVRLTRKRIEAATPMTLAEFRADKDQLRAEFAMSARRLEMNVEALRQRLAGQLEDVNRKKANLSALRAERDQIAEIVQELEERETGLRRRIAEIEREGNDLAARLRQRERELADRTSELNALRASGKRGRKKQSSVDPASLDLASPDLQDLVLSGDYANDVEDLLRALDGERQRADELEARIAELLERAEGAETRESEAVTKSSALKADLASREADKDEVNEQLTEAQSRIAAAESRLSAILEEVEAEDPKHGSANGQGPLALTLAREEELEDLRNQISSVETTIMEEWADDRLQQSHLRERLNDIASEVSRLVYAADAAPNDRTQDPSLFETVRKYAAEDGDLTELGAPGDGEGEQRSGTVSARMNALRDLRPN